MLIIIAFFFFFVYNIQLKEGIFMNQKIKNNDEEIFGFKLFNHDFTNRYHKKFQLGKTYQVEGEIKWGNKGNGFHMCTCLQDCFRYFPNQEVVMARVRGFGDKICYDDDNYGYLDMYVCQKIEILKVLSWDEILTLILELTDSKQLYKFLSCVTLTKEEIEMFKKRYQKIPACLKVIAYHQEGDKDVYSSPKVKKIEP